MAEYTALTDRLRPVFAHVEGFIAAGEINGAAVAVGVGSEQGAEWYGGQAAEQLPSGPEVLWPLASASKLYTAAAVMALVERGALLLSTPVHAVLPEFKGGGREAITLRHLLAHTSGLIYESPEMEQRLIAQTPIEAIIDEAYTYPLLFTPGTKHSYSDYNMAIAGRMASVTAGMSFPDLVRTYVLEPGELRDTFMPPPRRAYPRLAHIVNALAYGTAGAMYNAPYALDLAHPAFGTVASVRDLLRFGLLFAPHGQRRILSSATIRLMTTDQTGGHALGSLVEGAPETPRAWGLGFMICGLHDAGGYLPDLLAPGSYGHGGASGCMLVTDPVHDITVAFVSTHHARSGRARWSYRINSTINMVLAALT
jgi:CubicO group peptidase (beta-lactamase class C family)